MSDRYFPVTVMAGTIYLDGTGVYYDEAVVDMLVERVGQRKASTKAELLAVVNEPDRGLPAIRVWGARVPGGSCEDPFLG